MDRVPGSRSKKGNRAKKKHSWVLERGTSLQRVGTRGLVRWFQILEKAWGRTAAVGEHIHAPRPGGLPCPAWRNIARNRCGSSVGRFARCICGWTNWPGDRPMACATEDFGIMSQEFGRSRPSSGRRPRERPGSTSSRTLGKRGGREAIPSRETACIMWPWGYFDRAQGAAVEWMSVSSPRPFLNLGIDMIDCWKMVINEHESPQVQV